MFGIFRNASRRKKIMAIGLVIGVFMVSATAATMFNYEGNTGAQVAEAASRLNRQVDDTQEAFTDIKELIPEEQRLEAAPPAPTPATRRLGNIPRWMNTRQPARYIRRCRPAATPTSRSTQTPATP